VDLKHVSRPHVRNSLICDWSIASNWWGTSVAETDADQLKHAIEGLHRCSVSLARSVPVTERRNDVIVWQGTVHVFDLAGHPTSARAYAWSCPMVGSDKRRFFAVLHEGTVQSAADAVRLAVAEQHRIERFG
jgi:hypothetical protein